MRKIILILLIVFILFGGAAVGYFYFFKAQQSSVESVLPEKPLIALQVRDVQQNWTRIQQSDLWKALGAIDYDKLLSNELLDAKQKNAIKFAKSLFQGSLPDNPLLKKILDQEAMLAVYSPNLDLGSIAQAMENKVFGLLGDVMAGVYIATRVSADVQFAESLTQWMKTFGNQITKETLTYKDQTINLFALKGQEDKLGYIRYKDLIVFGFGEKSLKTIVDVINKDITALSKDEMYQNAKGSKVATDLSLFWDMKKSIGDFKNQIQRFVSLSDENVDEIENRIEEGFKNFQGFETFFASALWEENFQIKMDVFYNSKNMTESMAKFYAECKPKDNASLSYVPRDALAYQWNACLNLSYYWDEWQKEIAKLEAQSTSEKEADLTNTQALDISSKIKELESAWQLNIKNDVILAFGDEWGGYIKDVQLQPFPIPQFLAFVKVADQAKIQSLLNRVTEIPLFTAGEDKYGDVAVKYFSNPIFKDIEPGYAFIGDYLMIALNRAQLKESIDVSKDKNLSLASVPTMNKDFLGSNVSALYLETGRFIEKVEMILVWAQTAMGKQEESQNAFKTGSQKRLAALQTEVRDAQKLVEQYKGQIKILESQVATTKAQAGDATTLESELEELRKELQTQERIVAAAPEREAELNSLIRKYETSERDVLLRQVWVEQLLTPMLNALKTIGTLRAQTTISDGAFKSILFFEGAAKE